VVIDVVHLRRRDGHAAIDPPGQQRQQGARERVRDGGAGRGCDRARRPQLGEAPIDGASEVSLPHLENVVDLARCDQGGMKLAPLGDVSKQLAHGSNATGNLTAPREQVGHGFEEVLDIAEKEIVFIAIVGIKGRAANVGAIEHVLHGNGVERLLVYKFHERIAERVSRAPNATIDVWR
jgi:hypothetical protein